MIRRYRQLGRSWILVGAVLLLAALLLSVVVFPRILVRHDLGGQVAQLTPDQLAKATNDSERPCCRDSVACWCCSARPSVL